MVSWSVHANLGEFWLLSSQKTQFGMRFEFFQLKRLFSPKKYGWVWTNRSFLGIYSYFFFNCLTIRFCFNVLKILEFVQVQPRWLLQFTTFFCFANPVWKPVFKNQKKGHDFVAWHLFCIFSRFKKCFSTIMITHFILQKYMVALKKYLRNLRKKSKMVKA